MNKTLDITIEKSSTYPIIEMTAEEAKKVAPVGNYELGKRFRDIGENETASQNIVVGTTNVVSYQ